jgi:hypothetical protein
MLYLQHVFGTALNVSGNLVPMGWAKEQSTQDEHVRGSLQEPGRQIQKNISYWQGQEMADQSEGRLLGDGKLAALCGGETDGMYAMPEMMNLLRL